MDLSVTQDDIDTLLAMEKHRVDDQVWSLPTAGGSVCIPLRNTLHKEEFLLDVQRSSIRITKATYQNRGRRVIILARLDLDGPPHQNPDGEEVPCPHLHLFREGYADKWASRLTGLPFSDPSNLQVTLDEFMKFCNVTLRPLTTWPLM